MIHAYIFLAGIDDGRAKHGKHFLQKMREINTRAGTSISIYHRLKKPEFRYEDFMWRCSGACRLRRPKYGWFRNKIDSGPGPQHKWWARHQITCGGTFKKLTKAEIMAEWERLDGDVANRIEDETNTHDLPGSSNAMENNQDDHKNTVSYDNNSTDDLIAINHRMSAVEISVDSGRDCDSITIIDDSCYETFDVDDKEDEKFSFLNSNLDHIISFDELFGGRTLPGVEEADIRNNNVDNEYVVCAICEWKLLYENIPEHYEACTGLSLTAMTTANETDSVNSLILPFYKFRLNVN